MTKQNKPPAKAGAKAGAIRQPTNPEFISRVLGLRDGQLITPRLLRIRKDRLRDARGFWADVFCESIQSMLVEAAGDGMNSNVLPNLVTNAGTVADEALVQFERRWEGVD